MNEHLKLGQGAIIKGFVGSAQDEQNYIYSLANNCRGNYQPVFANETQYLPTFNNQSKNEVSLDFFVSTSALSLPEEVIYTAPEQQIPIVTATEVPVFEAQSNTSDNNQAPVYSGNLTIPPKKQKNTVFLEMVIVGLGAALITKIFL
jgi:hypothetical protein